MSTLKPILRELKDAALKGGIHAKDKLHQLADNLDGHLDTVIRQVRDNDTYDNTVDVNIRRFNRNANHNSVEYDRQYNEQMNTLQSTSVADWMRNRIAFLGSDGRSSDSRLAQENARSVALEGEIERLVDQGASFREARQEATEWMRTQAATHRLDGVAGGDVSDVSGVGDSNVNSSLGSQWRSRVGDIDRGVIDYVNANPGLDFDSVFINVTLR